MKTLWRCKDGRVLDIRDMETTHLKNCVAMIRRNGFVTFDEYLSYLGAAMSCQGDMASYYAEQAVCELKVSNTLDEMEKLIAKRRRERVYYIG